MSAESGREHEGGGMMQKERLGGDGRSSILEQLLTGKDG